LLVASIAITLMLAAPAPAKVDYQVHSLVAVHNAHWRTALYAASVEEGRKADEAAQQARAREAEASKKRRQSPTVAPSAGGGGGGFLGCVKHRESRGDYTVSDNGDGGEENMGAYQFSQSTWDNTARHAGRYDLVGVRPSDASPADQDAMAAELLAWQGTGPWGGSCN